MKLRSIILTIGIIGLLCGCSRGAEAPSAAVNTARTTAIPVAEASAGVKAETVATSTPRPVPTPTPTPTPVPTPEPTPTPTPFPFPDSEATFLEENSSFYYVTLDDALKARITGISFPSNPKDCKLSYDDLRYVRILYVNYDGETCEGELMVNRKVADDVMHIFYKLYESRYELASVRLVDDYGEVADDNLSMADNNTSSFCYRKVTGSKKLSWHSYGCAIDINPVENPYINGSRVSPPAGKEYVKRKNLREHMISHSDLAYKVFRSYGWKWGGDFGSNKDYQHFYKELNYKR